MDGIGSSNHKVDSRSKPYVGAAAILLRVDEPCPLASSSGPIGPEMRVGDYRGQAQIGGRGDCEENTGGGRKGTDRQRIAAPMRRSGWMAVSGLSAGKCAVFSSDFRQESGLTSS
ncbi:hypothetical protein B296_00001861 [Ensete ventricosum]|uniref:Uncharacterized protein n=1 Tax=Ensete ventricosum TaxID=4639 RepID=A0A427AUI6_ENSVE|nr:hypothetical protein B296_00001861 [Ensete ventricosum]